MKLLKVKYIIRIITVFTTVLLSFEIYSQQQGTLNRDNSLMSRAVKHHNTIPRLTYFIHLEDSIIQLFNVSVEKTKEDIHVIGYTADLDVNKLKLYQTMRDNPKLKIKDENDKLNANQVHIFVQNLVYNNGKITVNKSSTDNYTLYEGGISKSNKKWIKPLLMAVISVGVVAGVIILVKSISNSLANAMSS